LAYIHREKERFSILMHLFDNSLFHMSPLHNEYDAYMLIVKCKKIIEFCSWMKFKCLAINDSGFMDQGYWYFEDMFSLERISNSIIRLVFGSRRGHLVYYKFSAQECGEVPYLFFRTVQVKICNIEPFQSPIILLSTYSFLKPIIFVL
jgi:hypothetical protein